MALDFARLTVPNGRVFVLFGLFKGVSMLKVILSLALAVMASACTASRADYVRFSSSFFESTKNYEKIPILKNAPQGRNFEVIGIVMCAAGPGQPYSDIVLDLRRQAAAAGGHALVGLQLGTWESTSNTTHTTIASSVLGNQLISSATTIGPISVTGGNAAAHVIRYIELSENESKDFSGEPAFWMERRVGIGIK
jgi:hypothetical protein